VPVRQPAGLQGRFDLLICVRGSECQIVEIHARRGS
jgi:hypothetical protein